MDKMGKILKEALGNVVNDETIQIVNNAIAQKLDETKEQIRREIEDEVRAELAERFEFDRQELIAAMDETVTENIQEELKNFKTRSKKLDEERAKASKAIKEAKSLYENKFLDHKKILDDFLLRQIKNEIVEFRNDRRAIQEKRVKLSKAIVEAKKVYDQKLEEHKTVLKNFMMKQLAEEIGEFQQDRRLLAEKRIKYDRDLREARTAYKKQLSERIGLLENFILKQLSKEIDEFQEDKKALNEQRVKLAKNSRIQLAEAKAKFIKESRAIVEKTVNEALKEELTQFRDDIKRSRENNFGRKIFEQFAAEFMTSHWSEGSQVKALSAEKEELAKKTRILESKLMSVTQETDKVKKQALLEKDRAERAIIKNKLLRNLSRDKSALMEELLADVPTNRLEEKYRFFLPKVLREDENKTSRRSTITNKSDVRGVAGRRNLNETATVRKPVVLTGTRHNKLTEFKQEEVREKNENNKELAQVLKLAGI